MFISGPFFGGSWSSWSVFSRQGFLGIYKIAGVITPEAVNNLKNEIGGIFTILKSNHFDEGQRYGYLACVIPEDKYRVVIENNM